MSHALKCMEKSIIMTIVQKQKEIHLHFRRREGRTEVILRFFTNPACQLTFMGHSRTLNVGCKTKECEMKKTCSSISKSSSMLAEVCVYCIEFLAIYLIDYYCKV